MSTYSQFSTPNPKTVVITSGYFNPIHPGHIECFYQARKLGDKLVVIVNSDHQARLKRGVESFQDEDFRMNVAKSIKWVDEVVLSIDQDGSICMTLEKLIRELKADWEVENVIFAKGGDRFAREVPEAIICEKYGVKIVDGLGAKTHNSSDYAKKQVK
jgi:cytidyltransferase-like protein